MANKPTAAELTTKAQRYAINAVGGSDWTTGTRRHRSLGFEAGYKAALKEIHEAWDNGSLDGPQLLAEWTAPWA